MLGIIQKYYDHYRLGKIKKTCVDKADIGEWFDIELGARVVNESKNKSHITLGHHNILAGTLIASPNGKIKIGNYCYIGNGSFLGAADSITIGDYVGVAAYTYIVDNNNHPIDPEKRIEHRKRVAPGGEGYASVGTGWELSRHASIVIEDNVWIGMYCYIGKGVRIGEGAIVARQSVVTKDVPPYSVVAGNPAKVVKELSKKTTTK